jgi:heme-degrading monooxygenase HmoA
VLRRVSRGEAEFTLISLWESWDAIKAFAGAEYEKAVYYPEDQRFLLQQDPNVTHHEVLSSPPG